MNICIHLLHGVSQMAVEKVYKVHFQLWQKINLYSLVPGQKYVNKIIYHQHSTILLAQKLSTSCTQSLIICGSNALFLHKIKNSSNLYLYLILTFKHLASIQLNRNASQWHIIIDWKLKIENWKSDYWPFFEWLIVSLNWMKWTFYRVIEFFFLFVRTYSCWALQQSATSAASANENRTYKHSHRNAV